MKRYHRGLIILSYWFDSSSRNQKGDNMSDDKKFHEEQLKKVRTLKPVAPPPKINKPKFVPKTTVMKKAGRGR